ncbi:MAG: S49 family peptidase [Endozoicomonas sp. (ex Botrylloides leachii)]|nr:S49 family peptidase [Endozoicomonas sp. (ex Botrylloides leachii)]
MDKWQEPKGAVSATSSDDNRTWKLLEELATSSLKEQRRSRRWGIFFKILIFIWLFLMAGLVYKASKIDVAAVAKSTPHTALVELNGVISDGAEASADNINEGLRAAFKSRGTKAVILKINSPGGSPVQAGYIYDEIMRLRKLHPTIPLYAVISDIGASGGYYVASAADKIYANKASMVGSIGVIATGFGFVKAMDKLGITRRSYTSGRYKDFMDPFLPMNAEAAKQWQASLDTVHQQFIDSVKRGRGDRLSHDPDLFTGMVWTGEKAKTLGLIDGFGSADSVAREVVGQSNIVDFTPHLSPLERFAKQMGVEAAHVVMQEIGAEGVQLR